MRQYDHKEYKANRDLVIICRDGTTPYGIWLLDEEMYDECVLIEFEVDDVHEVATAFADGRIFLTFETPKDLFFKD